MRTPEQADGATDALLVCLALVAKQLGHPVHVPAMRQGFALDDAGRMPLEAYPDLAHQHGLLAGWSRKRLADIPSYVMPVLVSLVDGRACVLRAIDGNTRSSCSPDSAHHTTAVLPSIARSTQARPSTKDTNTGIT